MVDESEYTNPMFGIFSLTMRSPSLPASGSVPIRTSVSTGGRTGGNGLNGIVQ